MATTASHTAADVDQMSLNELNRFAATDYAGLQQYAKVLALNKEQTNNGQTAQAAASQKHAQSKRGSLS